MHVHMHAHARTFCTHMHAACARTSTRMRARTHLHARALVCARVRPCVQRLATFFNLLVVPFHIAFLDEPTTAVQHNTKNTHIKSHHTTHTHSHSHTHTHTHCTLACTQPHTFAAGGQVLLLSYLADLVCIAGMVVAAHTACTHRHPSARARTHAHPHTQADTENGILITDVRTLRRR